MFERITGLRPAIRTRFDLVRQERAVIGPRAAAMPIVRESILGSSEDQARMERLRDSIRYVCSQGKVHYRDGSWIAGLPAQRAVTYDIRRKRDVVLRGGPH
jgi:hypothetical protein